MRRLGIFLLVASCALPPAQALAQSRSERQQARVEAIRSRIAERSRPAAAQPRPQAAMPRIQRPDGPRQQRAFRPEGSARFNRMMDPDASQPIRSRSFEGPRYDRGPGRAPRVFNTASVEQPIQAPPAVSNPGSVQQPMTSPTASNERIGRNDGDRADRIREWMNRNRDQRDGRNRGGNFVATPNPTLENQPGAVTSPNPNEQEGRRHWGDGHRDGDRDGHRHGNRNWRDRHRNWHERHADDPNFNRNHRRWHNREWWRRNYNRFALFGGGYYYWNRGYWYPAYGYHPTYSTYTYDAPLYSYNGLPPGQVIALVQTQLQQRGYYNYAVDGTYGPMTEQALLNYQADAGLPMTGEIDQETLSSLGFQ